MKTGEITGGALMSAVAVTLMYVLSLFPSLTLTGASLAGFAVMVVLLKWGKKAAYLCYGSASVLALLLIGNKEAPLLFLLFFGYYPMFKVIVEQKCRKFWAWIVKLIVANLATALGYILLKTVFQMPADMAAGLWVTYALIMLTFVLYDIAFTRVIYVAIRRFKLQIHLDAFAMGKRRQ